MKELYSVQVNDKQWRIGVLFVGLMALLLHFDAINNDLVSDDNPAIKFNKVVYGDFDFVDIMTNTFWGPDKSNISSWRPLTTLTFALNHAIHSYEPAGYHIVNLFLHALASVLVALLASCFGVSRIGALLAALLFAVHPIHVEAIAPAVGRADLLLMITSAAAILLWERRRTAPSLVCLALALMSKEMAVVTACVLVWRDWTKNGGRPSLQSIGLRWTLPIAMTALWLVVRFAILGNMGTLDSPTIENPIAGATFSTRLWTAGYLYSKVLGLLIFPAKLLREYAYAEIMPLTQPTAISLLGIALLLSTTGVVIWAAIRRPNLSFTLSIWLGGFLLVSNLGPATPMIFAERVFYVPTAGLFIAILYSIERLKVRFGLLSSIYVLLFAVSVAFGVRSVYRVKDWKDGLTAIRVALTDSPNSIKHLLAAVKYLTPSGELSEKEAEAYLNRALRLKEDHPMLHVEAAKFYVSRGQREKALNHIKRASEWKPIYQDLPSVKCAYATRFDLPDALAICEYAVKLAPYSDRIWEFYAIALDKSGQTQKAEEAFRTAFEREEVIVNNDTALNYGVFLFHHGRYREARNVFSSVLQVKPDNKKAKEYLEQMGDLGNSVPRSRSKKP